MDMRIYEIAEYMVNKRLTCTDDMRYLHMAGIFNDMSCEKLYTGINRSTKKIWSSSSYDSIHAEIDAMYNYLSRAKKYSKVDLIVIRINKQGKYRQSRPCYHCIMRLNKSMGIIKNIYYTNDNGDITVEKLTDMLNSEIKHIAGSGRKHKNNCNIHKD